MTCRYQRRPPSESSSDMTSTCSTTSRTCEREPILLLSSSVETRYGVEPRRTSLALRAPAEPQHGPHHERADDHVVEDLERKRVRHGRPARPAVAQRTADP